MKTIKTKSDELFDHYVELCKERIARGFKVVEVEVNIPFDNEMKDVFPRLYDETRQYGVLNGWEFRTIDGYMSKAFDEGDVTYKKFYLKYTL
jgi:hypothetical protein